MLKPKLDSASKDEEEMMSYDAHDDYLIDTG